MKLCKLLFSIMLSLFLILYNSPRACAEFEIKSPCAVLMDQNTGRVLFEKNSHEVRYCSSLMKIANLLVIAEAVEIGEISESDSVCISDNASQTQGANVWLKSGETLTVKDLIKALAMVSAGDAAVALAEHLDKSEGKFIARLNKKATELGLKSTVFKDCVGSDEDGNVTSAHDLALISRELMEYENMSPYMSTWIDHIRDGQTQIVNTNKLIKMYGGVKGIKTGTSKKSGSCMAAAAQKNDVNLIAVVLGSENPQERFKETIALLDYGFSEYAPIVPKVPEEIPQFIKVTNGMENNVPLQIGGEESFLAPKVSEKNISYKINIQEEIPAPVKEGQKVGEIIYSINETVVHQSDIMTTSAVEEITFNRVFEKLICRFFSL